VRKYRNIKGNLQPKRILKYSEEWIEYRKKRGADSVKVDHCDVDADGFHDAIVRDWRSPALKKLQTCEEPAPSSPGVKTFAELNLTPPTFNESSGGTCESSGGQAGTPDPATLYCPDLDYGGFLQSTFYHSPYAYRTSFRSSVYVDAVLDDWYHITFTRSADTGAMYINGELISVGTLMNSIGRTNNNFYLGCVKASSWTPDYFFNGKLDQIGLWDRALDSAEVSQLYNSGTGLPHTSWDAALKTDTSYVLEFDQDIGLSSGSSYGTLTNSADGSDVTSLIKNQQSSARSFMQTGGKISNYAFTPVYEDDLVYPIQDTAAASAAAARYRPAQYMIIPETLGYADPWSLSVWVSPHGLGYGKQTAEQIAGTTSAFTYDNESWRSTYGVLFSDYSGYSNGNALANFSISFNGKFRA
jgi:hypothetical protein